MANRERLIVGLVLVVLIAGLIVSTALYFQADEAREKESIARNQAEQERQSAETESHSHGLPKRILYPPPPAKPRIEFLTSISDDGDLRGPEKVGAFAKELASKGQDLKKIFIRKPYGVAICEGKLYVCDLGRRVVEKFDFEEKTSGYLTKVRQVANPVNICIDGGKKYVADPNEGRVFVYGRDDELVTALGGDLKLKPFDISVRGRRCYVTDMNSNQVVVLDIASGKEIMRIGVAGDRDGQFKSITQIALDMDENIYVTDKVLGRVSKFDKEGVFLKSIGKLGDRINDFVRPKGIDVDRQGRIWVIDSGTEMAKIYNSDGQLLMFFGSPGGGPGNMNLPASISIDYDNVELFREYFAEGAQIEFLVLVSNQYGIEKVNIYGFLTFPVQEKAIEE